MFRMSLENLKPEIVDAVIAQRFEHVELISDCERLVEAAERSEHLRGVIRKWATDLKIEYDDAEALMLHGVQLGYRAAVAVSEAQQLERMI
jgi:hypothetical protein